MLCREIKNEQRISQGFDVGWSAGMPSTYCVYGTDHPDDCGSSYCPLFCRQLSGSNWLGDGFCKGNPLEKKRVYFFSQGSRLVPPEEPVASPVQWGGGGGAMRWVCTRIWHWQRYLHISWKKTKRKRLSTGYKVQINVICRSVYEGHSKIIDAPLLERKRKIYPST